MNSQFPSAEDYSVQTARFARLTVVDIGHLQKFTRKELPGGKSESFGSLPLRN